MKSLHLTMMIFFQVLLASAVLYLTTFTSASPLLDHPHDQLVNQPQKVKVAIVGQHQEQKHAPIVEPAVQGPQVVAAQQPAVPVPAVQQAPASPKQPETIITERKDVIVESPVVAEKSKVVKEEPIKAGEKKDVFSSPIVPPKDEVVEPKKQPSESVASGLEAKSGAEKEVSAKKHAVVEAKEEFEAMKQEPEKELKGKSEIYNKPVVTERKDVLAGSPVVPEVVAKTPVVAPVEPEPVKVAHSPVEPKPEQKPQAAALVAPEPVAPAVPVAPVAPVVSHSGPSYSAATPAVVKGGLGPLHLLATTLCSYQPDRLVADDCLNQLYSRRAVLRKSLFEFMSLKFTNLEKLSSRLGSGLQVVPVKSILDPAAVNSRGVAAVAPTPSHGWPVVGKCTAHDLKLMGEAAWCDNEQQPSAAKEQQPPAPNTVANSEEPSVDKITSNKHLSRAQSARSIVEQPSSSLAFLPSPEQSSVISKLLHVSDIKDAPLVESSIYNLNLTQQQLATLEAHATSTRECRRNALRYTKALFQHLAEDQKSTSETWPKLYALISADDCARKRMIDIITALSGFRTDVTSIRRDNLEFAFAMDDLRTKVLENEVNVALTFDKQFIEVEQFLQQSVQLMLSNIDPNRAKITSMRYRSLMYGTANSDDQCIELHQRLLAQSYPTDCNPTQFGQLPDVLRMTASSLELWSIEKEISLHTSRVVDYPNSNPAGQQKVKEDVNECIANLVSS